MKTCLVTGATSGIGNALVEKMIAEGFRVICIARNQSKLSEMVSTYGSDKIIPIECDVSIKDQVQEATSRLIEQEILPDIFFLNAGIAPTEPFDKLDLNLHHKIFETNYFGVLHWVEACLPQVLSAQKKAQFIVTSSFSAINAFPCFSGYSASKAAINQCFETLHLQHRKNGIDFLYVLAGPVNTPLLEGEKIKGMIEPKRAVEKIFEASKKQKQALKFPMFWKYFSWLLKNAPQRIKEKIIYG